MSSAATDSPELYAAQPSAVAPPPHVPKIVNPATRTPYSPPDAPPVNRSATEKQSGASTATKVVGGGPKEEDSSTTNKLNRKRVVFRTRSSSLRGSLDQNEGREYGAEGGDKSSLATIKGGKKDDGDVNGGAGEAIASSATANASKQRGVVVVLPERRQSISSKGEEKTKGLRENASGSRLLTASGLRGSNSVDKGKKEEENGDEEESDQEVKAPQFKTAKERECWELYQRMCDKGLSVSYDTILRGMLTPTEYRMRRNALPSTC